MSPDTNLTSNILIVDDTLANLKLLSGLLQTHGYKVRPVPSGEIALQVAKKDPPSLILLDINMPGMNGYEVCEQLKSDEKLKEIPVIFISALNDTVDKVKGFGLGAVDYITKPFQFEEVEARVRTHLELARLRKELEYQNANLEEIVALRTSELKELSDRLAIMDKAKGEFLSLISHEVRTPLVGLFGVAEILLSNASNDSEAAEYEKIYEQSRRRLLTLIDDALLLSDVGQRAHAGSQEQCFLDDALSKAHSEASSFAKYRDVQIAPWPTGLGKVRGFADHLQRALQSLLETAVKFASPHTTVRLSKIPGAGEIGLTIEANGLEIPPKVLPRFFNLMAITEPITPGGDLGLAPPLAERILSLYGGSVSVENLNPEGVRFTVCLRTQN